MVDQSIHHGGFDYPPSYFCVYFEYKNAYLKQETSEIVVKSKQCTNAPMVERMDFFYYHKKRLRDPAYFLSVLALHLYQLS